MTYVLIGGTGTLGKELMRQLLARDPHCRIVSLSRDELKQQEAKAEFPEVRFVVGDVRDRESVRSVMRGATTVFLLAAIKHVDVAEQNPLEAVKTNILGAVNVAEEAIAQAIPYVVFSNTDKAVLPITTYGYTKALAQNYLLSLNGERAQTKFSVFNWGNIAASRGSVIPIFARSLKEEQRVKITDMRMSRFWLTIEQAVRFLLANYQNAPLDRALIPPVKGASLIRVAQTVADLVGVTHYDVDVIGLRGTEKLYEVLESSHQGCLRSDTCPQYSDAELRDLIGGAV
jgi:UDP-N-acetylglucosamine 4,6-dehydratase